MLLAIVALFAKPVLGALLAGVCAGLGLASLVALARIPDLHVDPRTKVVYRPAESDSSQTGA
jgi:hypothetical protein